MKTETTRQNENNLQNLTALSGLAIYSYLVSIGVITMQKLGQIIALTCLPVIKIIMNDFSEAAATLSDNSYCLVSSLIRS